MTPKRTWRGEKTRCSCRCTSELRSATLSSTSANRSLQQGVTVKQLCITSKSTISGVPHPHESLPSVLCSSESQQSRAASLRSQPCHFVPVSTQRIGLQTSNSSGHARQALHKLSPCKASLHASQASRRTGESAELPYAWLTHAEHLPGLWPAPAPTSCRQNVENEQSTPAQTCHALATLPCYTAAVQCEGGTTTRAWSQHHTAMFRDVLQA